MLCNICRRRGVREKWARIARFKMAICRGSCERRRGEWIAIHETRASNVKKEGTILKNLIFKDVLDILENVGTSK
ncbi:hypothetical protein GWI33_021143 [Rhynchophorus ferrugineus]|uniref:Uncharacterized protein n=1 Tax=Rhynchophorus ferrugineus TaxID=354439 RepID=A0A834HQR5_RHYFE|nr:hypothetical protein GWI33_021143 [Rhynchophorus ferrugineus]